MILKNNFNISNIGNLAKFDPYALSLNNSSALSLNIGDFGSYGGFSGTVAGYTPVGGLRNTAYIITYAAPPVSSSSDRSVNIIKALSRAGNSGDILDFFKSIGRTNDTQGTVFVKSIQIITGAAARRGVAAPARDTSPVQERKPQTSKQDQNSNSSEQEKNGSSGSQCSEGEQSNTECRDN